MREFYRQSECRGRNIKLKPLVQNRFFFFLAGWSTEVSWSCSGGALVVAPRTLWFAGLWDLYWSSSGHPQQHRWHSTSGWCSPEWVFATFLGKAAAKASTSPFAGYLPWTLLQWYSSKTFLLQLLRVQLLFSLWISRKLSMKPSIRNKNATLLNSNSFI